MQLRQHPVVHREPGHELNTHSIATPAASRASNAAASTDPSGQSAMLRYPCTIDDGSVSTNPSLGPYASNASDHWAGSTDETRCQVRSITPGAADTSSQSSKAISPFGAVRRLGPDASPCTRVSGPA